MTAVSVPAAAAYDELPDGLVVADAAGVVTSVNRAAARLLAITPQEAIGQSLATVLPLVTAQGENWWECVAQAARLPRVTRQPERLLTLVRPHGDRDLTVTMRWIKDDGALRQTLVSFRDTAARARGERSSADLVSTVAHELRSPLTSVKGFTATLLAKWDRFSDEQKKLMLQTVNADADRVTRLLSELLDVSRIDAGRLEMRKQVVDLPTAVRKAFAGRVASGDPEERFVLVEEGPLPEMWLDPDKVEQILGNLIENAIRHGAGTVRVVVGPLDGASGVSGASGASLVVTDEGTGIAEETASRVFVKFWRGGQRRGGTGLGLYIVKGLVEAHSGSVAVGRSVASGGAEFSIRLPALPAPYEED